MFPRIFLAYILRIDIFSTAEKITKLMTSRWECIAYRSKLVYEDRNAECFYYGN